MTHWLDNVAKILNSPSGDLRELAEAAGCDPRTFYKHQDLSGCDLRSQNLAGMDFSNSNLENAIMDDQTIIDKKFDPRRNLKDSHILKLRIPTNLNTLVLNYMESKNLKDRDKLYHRLIREGYETVYTGKFKFYNNIIDKNYNMKNLLNITKLSSIDIEISFPFNLISYLIERYSASESICRLILIALIKKRIRFNSKKDYSNFSPNSFSPPKLIKVGFS